MALTGREEHTLKAEEKLLEFVTSKPVYIKKYLYSLTAANMSYKTKKEYIYGVCNYLAYLKETGVDISDIRNFTIDSVNEYMYHIQYKIVDGEKVPTSVSLKKIRWTALNNFFDFLVASYHGTFNENPISSGKIKRAKGKDNVTRVYMQKEDVQQVIMRVKRSSSTWNTRDLAIIYVLLQTGIRATALTEINLEDITYSYIDNTVADRRENNIIGATITITDKNNVKSDFILSKKAAIYLHRWCVDRSLLMYNEPHEHAVFINRYHKRLSTRGLENMINKYSPIINGKQITPHKYRATFGTTLYNETHDIRFVQTQMRHKSSDTTQIYIVENPNDKIKTTQIMDSLCFE